MISCTMCVITTEKTSTRASFNTMTITFKGYPALFLLCDNPTNDDK